MFQKTLLAALLLGIGTAAMADSTPRIDRMQTHQAARIQHGVTTGALTVPAYDLVVTHNKELWAIFKRTWKFKDDQPQRSQHLDLFATEVRELRDSLQALK